MLNNLPIFIWCEGLKVLVSCSHVPYPLRQCFIAFDFYLKKCLQEWCFETQTVTDGIGKYCLTSAGYGQKARLGNKLSVFIGIQS